MGGAAYVGMPAGTVLLAILVLAVVFIALWSIFTPDDETRYYRELGVKGGKAKKVVDEEIDDDEVAEDLA